MALAPGTQVGSYRILDRLGAGGMGEVYRARDSRLERDVALKVLPASLETDAVAVERLLREARAAASLDHPNICVVHDVGVGEGRPYLAMELLRGETLRARLERGPLPLDELLDGWIQLADALDAAHRAGLVHRDLKPDNVMVTDRGAWKVLDFGLAKPQAAGEVATRAVTAPGVRVGTPAYLSPEQAEGRRVDARSDLFALGVLMYETATGRPPFLGDSVLEIVTAIVHRVPEPPSRLRSDLTPAIERLVLRALEKDPALRFQTAADLRAELQRVRRGEAPAAHASAPVLAVLPFENIAADAGSDYFAAGITEEIRAQLSRLSDLRVLSRSAAARYRDAHADLRRIREELGAGGVVGGTVRLAGGRVRIDVQLVDTQREQTLWTEQYDREMADIFQVQTDVAQRVADALRARFAPAAARPGGGAESRRPTHDLHAYQAFLRARELFPLYRGENVAGIELLKMALQWDPEFADAHALLARRYVWQAIGGESGRLQDAWTHARRAVEIDPQLPLAHACLAMVLLNVGRREQSRRALLHALALDPNNATAMCDLSIVEFNLGRLEDALYWARRQVALQPQQSVSAYHLGFALLYLRDDEETARFFTAALRQFSDVARLEYLAAQLMFLRGDAEGALREAARLVEKHPDDIEVQSFAIEMAHLCGEDVEDRLRAYGLHNPTGWGIFLPQTYGTLYAYHLARGGDEDAARDRIESARAHARAELDAGSDRADQAMDLASLHWMAGEREDAFDWLDRAFEMGWRDYAQVAADPIFAGMRHEPRFAEWLRRAETSVARARLAAASAGGVPPETLLRHGAG